MIVTGTRRGEATRVQQYKQLRLVIGCRQSDSAMSYAEQFNIAAVADRDTYPGLDIFAAGVQGELRVLEAKVLTAAVA